MSNENAIYKKLLDFQTRVSAIKKDLKNPAFKSSYASLSQIISEVKPVLSEVGLVLLQPVSEGWVETRIIDAETGVTISVKWPLGENDTPQKLGSKITYYRRYQLNSLLSLEIEDDDGNEASARPPMSLKAEHPKKPESNFEKALKGEQPKVATGEPDKTAAAIAYIETLPNLEAVVAAEARAAALPDDDHRGAILAAIRTRRKALAGVA